MLILIALVAVFSGVEIHLLLLQFQTNVINNSNSVLIFN
jgi:hypothetical protein